MGRVSSLLRILSQVAALAVPLGLAGAERAAAAQDTLTIGVHLPLRGVRAPVGRVIRDAVERALADVNRTGGVEGVPLAAAYEDSGESAESAVAAARTLAGDPNVVAIVGELFSPFVLASRDVIEQSGVPYVIGGTSPRTTAGARWIFRVAASDTLLAELLARYMVEQRKLTKLAVLSSRVGIHNARAELLVKVLRERYSIAPLARETWKPDDRDFTPQLERVGAAAVAAVIALGETGEGAAFLRQAASLPGRPLVIAHRDFGARSVLAQAGPAAEGVLIVTEYLPALLDAERQAWARAWEERHGEEASIIAAQHYDAVLVLAEAMRRAGTTRALVRAGLERLRGFRGVMADYAFDANHNGVHRFYVARIAGRRPGLEAILDERP